jgi:hypothetical protein
MEVRGQVKRARGKLAFQQRHLKRRHCSLKMSQDFPVPAVEHVVLTTSATVSTVVYRSFVKTQVGKRRDKTKEVLDRYQK